MLYIHTETVFNIYTYRIMYYAIDNIIINDTLQLILIQEI